MNRRRFLHTTTGTSLAIALSAPLHAKLAGSPYAANIGLQLYTLRGELGKDAVTTLKAVAAAGYKQAELYGFPDCQPLIDASKEAGLAINSTHFKWESAVSPSDEGFSDYKKIVENAKETGISHLVVPFIHEKDRKTLDDYKRVAANLNKAAAISMEAGIQLSYHNHSFEFKPLEADKSGFDVFVGEFDENMHFELDVFWVKVGGVDPVELINQLKGRVSQLHLKDLKKDSEIPHYGSVSADSFKELGNGMIDIEAIIKAAAATGIAHCHVEQDQSPDALASVRESIAWLGVK